MLEICSCQDPERAEMLWLRHWPRQSLFDLWPVRACFQSQFDHGIYFLVASESGRFRGMLALSWIEEEQLFGHFPGELWHGKTWLEQNRLLASDPVVMEALIDHIPAAFQIRYLNPDGLLPPDTSLTLDEIGYLFYPPAYGFSFQEYKQDFSGKSRKKIRRELDCLTRPGVSYRYNHLADIDLLFRLNMENFQGQSYFADPRFLKSFEHLFAWLHDRGLLRITTVLIGGKIAAVDAGAVWNSCYTVMAGATHADFPGVAKLINFHHMEWACHERLFEVDFLCGDFNWKQRFHLSQRPLYQLTGARSPAWRQHAAVERRAAVAL